MASIVINKKISKVVFLL